jgi:LPXTG-motif cell wall-anchored protein
MENKIMHKLIASLVSATFIMSVFSGTATAASVNHTEPTNLCVNYTRGELSADLKATQGTATFTNKSKNCSYKIGLMVYKVMTGMKKEEQQPFQYEWSYIKPGEAITLTVSLPNCGYQVDPFQGEPLWKIGNSKETSYKLSGRLLGAGHYHPTANGGPCAKTITPATTPTPVVPSVKEMPAELPQTGNTSPAIAASMIGLLSAGIMYLIRRGE